MVLDENVQSEMAEKQGLCSNLRNFFGFFHHLGESNRCTAAAAAAAAAER